MNFFNLLQNSELFQGERKIKKETNCYFEGWYFKISSKQGNISFIPGIQINNNEKSAFIQIITNFSSYYINYSFDEFHFSHSPFFITLGNNFFSLDKIKIDIKDPTIQIYGNLTFYNILNIKKNFFIPNIMGPFSFIPFMECNHAILSMRHTVNGNLIINNINYNFNNGIGYVEKDWGSSFPCSYLWAQANHFSNTSVSCMISIANIPFSLFCFRGFICIFILNGKEYKFTTYSGSKIINYNISKNNFNIKLESKNYILHAYSNNKNQYNLKAPRCGIMEKDIYESINSEIFFTLYEGKNILFEGSSINCGIEIVE